MRRSNRRSTRRAISNDAMATCRGALHIQLDGSCKILQANWSCLIYADSSMIDPATPCLQHWSRRAPALLIQTDTKAKVCTQRKECLVHEIAFACINHPDG